MSIRSGKYFEDEAGENRAAYPWLFEAASSPGQTQTAATRTGQRHEQVEIFDYGIGGLVEKASHAM